MAKTPKTAEQIDPDALYSVRTTIRLDFERIKFGPLIETEVRGARLARLLADPDNGPRVHTWERKE